MQHSDLVMELAKKNHFSIAKVVFDELIEVKKFSFLVVD